MKAQVVVALVGLKPFDFEDDQGRRVVGTTATLRDSEGGLLALTLPRDFTGVASLTLDAMYEAELDIEPTKIGNRKAHQVRLTRLAPAVKGARAVA